jgi:molybdate transport system substrate-binding protein
MESENMRLLKTVERIGFAFLLLLAVGARVQAADITVLASNGVKTVLEELAPRFETSSGHKLVFRFATAAELKAQIEKGEAFDVAILTAAIIDDLIKQGKLAADTRADIARSGAGIAIRKGARRPEIATADALKRTLLSAKSIAYVGQGATAGIMTGIFERLGIVEEMRTKTKRLSGSAADAVASGEAELGFTQISEILPVAGAELAGPLPSELQVYTVFPAAVNASARQAAAARSLITFLTAPAAVPVIKAKGMEPALARGGR